MKRYTNEMRFTESKMEIEDKKLYDEVAERASSSSLIGNAVWVDFGSWGVDLQLQTTSHN